MKHCPTCTSQIAESSTTCAVCGAQVTAPTAPSAGGAVLPHASERPAQANVHSATAPVNPGARRRELLLFAVAVIAGGIFTFALLFTRGGSSSNLSAAAVDAASRPPTSSAKPPATAAVQTWSLENRAHWLGNTRRGAAFELLAENVVQTWVGPVRPALVVRCMSRAIQTFVYTGSAMKIEPHTDGKTVTVSVDDEPLKTERWPDSDDHDALFAPDGAAFAQRLLHAHTLRFGYSPHNANDVVAHFHVSGLAELIDPVAKECGGKK